MPDVHWCVTVDYQQIVDSNIANQIHGFTIDYGKFIAGPREARNPNLNIDRRILYCACVPGL